MRKLLVKQINSIRLGAKMIGIYLLCGLIPILVAGGMLVRNAIYKTWKDDQYQVERIASATEYQLQNMLASAHLLASNIYMSSYIENFLDQGYESPLEYYRYYQTFMKESLLGASTAVDNTKITLYGENDTIINGGAFRQISTIQGADWYEEYLASGKDSLLLFVFDDWQVPSSMSKRKAMYFSRLNRVTGSDREKLVKIEIDYSTMTRKIQNLELNHPTYICNGDTLLFSTVDSNNIYSDYEKFIPERPNDYYRKDFDLYGQKISIYVQYSKRSFMDFLHENEPLMLVVVMFSIILPIILMTLINHSVVKRVRTLESAFLDVDADRMVPIAYDGGTDEIGHMMHRYNKMVDRMNELIQTVYVERLKEQEIDIARQKAELLALHSQIDPHFLFNALESIRMHSILKREYETADMVGRLAVMERQTVDWHSDSISVAKEAEFVQAYLELQKYRFGERLVFEMDIQEECKSFMIPKLTLVTFVENACIHGIEEKQTVGWVFVRVFMRGEDLVIEVEDTGNGMDEEQTEALLYNMQNANIEMLRGKGRVGVINACLRLKMVTEDNVAFSIESEQGIGTNVRIQIPVCYVNCER